MNPLVALSQLARVPKDLSSVTEIGPEVPDEEAGLRPGTARALWQRFEALYATGVQPGLQLCVRHQGQVILNRSIGHARGNEPDSRESAPEPMRLNTPINLFSAAKAVTAMLVHKLEENDLLRIDDAVADYIPGFERHGKGSITLRQVLTHRAGLAHLPRALAQTDDIGAALDPQYLLDVMLDLRPGKIGGAPSYHAISGGLILAEVMRRATGQDPRVLLNSLIKKPLKLKWLDFGVQPKDLDKVAVNAVTGYIPAPIAWQLGRIVGTPFSEAVSASNSPGFLGAVVPSGNMISTASDMARFYQCLLNGGALEGRQVFSAETVRRATMPDRPGASIDRTIGIPLRYSPGFMVGHKGLGLYGWNQQHTFGHLGLSSTLTWARRDTRTAVALITNGKPVLGPHLREMVAMFAALNACCENRLVSLR